MNNSTEVIVIGGGVIGTSVAYYAAKAGKKVILLDRGDIAAGTSGACDGFIIMQSKNPGPHLDLAMQSAALYRTLSAELDYDIEYMPCGGMIVAESEKQAQLLQGLIAKQRQAGLQVELLPIAEARRSEPLLAADLWGAAYCADDAQVNPIRLAQGFAQAARRLGRPARMAVMGLNPHAGEDGAFGDEERRHIRPAVERARGEGFDAMGPLPPDTVFMRALKGDFSSIVCMYHDQGHIPMKMLGFEETVNVTAGLPFVRTSVDHGTAFDIAYRGVASTGSFLKACEMAVQLTLGPGEPHP